MKRFILSTLITLASASCAFASEAVEEAQPAFKIGLQEGLNYIPGEVLVKFRSGVDSRTRSAKIRKLGGLGLRSLSKLGRSHIKSADGLSMKELIESYKRDPDVESVQPNYIYRKLAVPNDPYFPQLWGQANTGQTVPNLREYFGEPIDRNNPGSAGKDLGLVSAWNYRRDCSSTTVAVLDSGINYNHDDLAPNMWRSATGTFGYDFVDSDSDPMDLNGHGTHVAGIIGARGNNGIGTSGVCWNAKLMAVRILDTTGSGDSAGLAQGIRYAADNGAKVINLSLGTSTADQVVREALTYAMDKGVLVIAAAGNDASNNESKPTYPCSYNHSNLLCVAALDQKHELAEFSNYGSTAVDIGAPGVNIVSAWPGQSSYLIQSFDPAKSPGWTMANTSSRGWGVGVKRLEFVTGETAEIGMLTIPFNWNMSSQYYASRANDKAYKSYDLSRAAAAVLSFFVITDLEENADFLNFGVKADGGDPFAASGNAFQLTGEYDDQITVDLHGCRTSSCSIGFQLTSNASVQKTGVGIGDFMIETLVLQGNKYNVLNGTSQAAPHVAGLAAMIASQNPAFDYAAIIKAIKEGGVTTQSLVGRTSTGKAANAFGALSYISALTGVAAVVR